MPDPLVRKHWRVLGASAATTEFVTEFAALEHARTLSVSNIGVSYVILEAKFYVYAEAPAQATKVVLPVLET